MTIEQLTTDQLRDAALHMSPGSDGADAGKRQDWAAVREALAEAIEDGYAVEDFLA